MLEIDAVDQDRGIASRSCRRWTVALSIKKGGSSRLWSRARFRRRWPTVRITRTVR